MVAPEPSPGASIRALRHGSASNASVIAISGRIAPEDPVRLGAALEALLGRGTAAILWIDVGCVETPDAAAIDALCRMRLVAGRFGRRVHLVRASPELRELLYLVGLSVVMPGARPSGRRLGRQAEQRKQPPGVEEEGDPRDPAT